MLETENLYLRPVEPEDLPYLQKWENNLAYFPYKEDVSFYSRAQLEQFIVATESNLLKAGQQRFMIEVKKGKTIGAIDLFDYDPLHKRAGIGIVIGDEQERKKGYATESLTRIMEYGFDVLFLNQMYCDIRLRNESSINLFLKCGFEQTGVRKNWVQTKKGYADVGFFQRLNK